MTKKLFYFSIICGLSSYLTAQVGIGTDNPQAALHVVPKNNQNSLKVEGLKTDRSGDNLLSVDNDAVVNKTPLSSIKSSIKSEIKGEIGRGEEVTGVLIDVRHVLGTNVTYVNHQKTVDIAGVSITYTPKVDCNALVNVSALPISYNSGYPVQGTINLIINNNKVSSQYYSSTDSPQYYTATGAPITKLVNLGNYSTITRVVPLKARKTYTFKLQAKSWKNNTVFNENPTIKQGLVHYYTGAISSDAKAMKSSMTILFYSR